MAEFFPLQFFPEDYFPNGFYADGQTATPQYADAALVADGTGFFFGVAVLSTRPVSRPRGGVYPLWRPMPLLPPRRRKYADANLELSGKGSATLSACGSARFALSVTAAASSEMTGDTTEFYAENQELLWLLAA